MIRDITGMNEMTDGSTPDPRTLTTVAKLANEGTNNALTSIVIGEKRILESLANAVILRLQDVVERGTAQGYIKSLGGNTLKFFKLSPRVALYEFGIFLEDKPTDDQRAMLMQQVQAGQANGSLDIEDAIIIQNTDNLKVAQQLLAYKIKKRREQAQQEAMQQQQMNAQVQQQSAQAAEQAKQQTLQVEAQVKSQLIQVEKEMDMKLLDLKYQYELKLEEMRQYGKIHSKNLENSGKKSVQKLKMGQMDDEKEDTSLTANPMQNLTQPGEPIEENEPYEQGGEPAENTPQDMQEDQYEGQQQEQMEPGME